MFSRVFKVRIKALCVCLQIFAVAATMATNNTKEVHISGTGILSSGTWDLVKTIQLENAFQTLNGVQCLKITYRQNNSIVVFEGKVNIKVNTSELQYIVNGLETALPAVIQVSISGMVTIASPNTTVCYKSSPSLKCTFGGTTDSAGWNLMQENRRLTLNSGSVVKLNSNCATSESSSCTEITLQGVTGDWVGMYECEFTTGSVRYTARAQLSVSLLPDVITMDTSALTVDCSQNQTSVDVNISATIQQSTETYEVWWRHSNDTVINQLYNTSSNGSLVYTVIGTMSCQKPSYCCPYLNVTFQNAKGQQTSAQVDIPVIYAGSIFCDGIVTDGDDWPKTPAGATVTINTCAVGRVGYKSRACIGPAWQDVYDNCINQELNTVLGQANNFQKGLEASPEMAMNIFQGLFNSSASASSNNIADLNASMKVLHFMATASSYNNLPEEVLPNFVNASSNLLQMTWNVAPLILYNMSSTFLQSVEDLVQNIKVNTSQGVNSTNIELRFCSSRTCDLSVFDVGVEAMIGNGILKTAAVRNLTNKLRNNYNHTKPAKLLLSATLQDNNDSSTNIKLDFPDDWQTCSKPLCVFWNTTEEVWSDAGCTAYNNDNGRTLCVCNHLTPFSVLMSEDKISAYSNTLDIITNVGLGVSIFSLLIFLTIECLVWSAVVKTNLAHFRHTAMVNIATFLLLADISMLASACPSILPDSWCLILTICKHMFFLAMFCWMLCLCIMLVHQLIFVFSPLRKKVFMLVSSIVGYALPVLIVGSSYVYCKYTNIPYYNVTTCWLVYESLFVGSLQSFLLPVGTIIFINILSILVVIVTMVKLEVADASKADDKNTAKGIVKSLAVLTPVSGITWIIGFFQLMLDKETPMFVAVEFFFTILNSFQGICILVTVCFKEEKVWQQLSKIVKVTFRGKSCNNTEIPLEEKSSTTNKA